jgi:hypothetical protein
MGVNGRTIEPQVQICVWVNRFVVAGPDVTDQRWAIGVLRTECQHACVGEKWNPETSLAHFGYAARLGEQFACMVTYVRHMEVQL